MNTLLLRLEGPMQSWGIQSLFPERDTLITPSKSGVIGLLCAALGRPRSASVDDLAELKMGVRVDREGLFAKDFQTTQQVAKATSKQTAKGEFLAVPRPDAVISNRYYLADACFLVGFEGDDNQLSLLAECNLSLQSPRWPLFLGRKSYVPSKSVWLEGGLRPGKSLVEALNNHSWLAMRPWETWNSPPEKLRYVIEDQNGSEVRHDRPISFELNHRRFAPRRVATMYGPCPEQGIVASAIPEEET